MPQHGPVQWQLGNRPAAAGPGPGIRIPGSWSVSRLVVCTKRPRGLAAGGLPAPICVKPEFAIGIGRPMCRPGVHVLNRAPIASAVRFSGPRPCTEGRPRGGWYMPPRDLRRHLAPPGRAVPVL